MTNRRKLTCVHFTGIQHDTCEAGIAYRDVNGGRTHLGVLPCLPNMPHLSEEVSAPCTQCRFPTDEEVAADEAEVADIMDKISRGVSPCCEAEIDETLVFKSGRNKGHGPRFCSKCRRIVFMV